MTVESFKPFQTWPRVGYGFPRYNKNSVLADGLLGLWTPWAMGDGYHWQELVRGLPVQRIGTPAVKYDRDIGTVVNDGTSANYWKTALPSEFSMNGSGGTWEVAGWFRLNSSPITEYTYPNIFGTRPTHSYSAGVGNGWSIQASVSAGATSAFIWFATKAEPTTVRSSGEIGKSDIALDTWYLAHGWASIPAYYLRVGLNGVQLDSDWTDAFIEDVPPSMYFGSTYAHQNNDSVDIGPVYFWNKILTPSKRARLYDPATRWELFETPIRTWKGWSAGAVNIVPMVVHHLRQQRIM